MTDASLIAYLILTIGGATVWLSILLQDTNSYLERIADALEEGGAE